MGSNSKQNPLPLEAAKADDAYLSALLLCFSRVFSAVLNAAVDLNLFEIIAKPQNSSLSPSEIASQLPNEHPELANRLERMLPVLASYSLLTCSIRINGDGKRERVYALSPMGEYFACDEDGGSLGPLTTLMHQGYHDVWYDVKDAIINLDNKNHFQKVNGLPSYQYMEKDKELNHIFNKAMAQSGPLEMKRILKLYKGFEGVSTLVDVGGGVGQALKQIISEYPSIKGINFDLPQVIQDAPPHPGIEHVGGSMFESVPKGDVILLKLVLHNWSDEECVKILRNCHKALPKHGKVIVLDYIIPEVPNPSNISKHDPNAKCEYHAGAIGHSTENCRALKFKVQNLIDRKWLTFKGDGPNVGGNPLPGHSGSAVNAVEEFMGQCLIRKVEDVRTPLRDILIGLRQCGMIQGGCEKEGTCSFDASFEHRIEECDEFKKVLQSLMDAHLIQISRAVDNEDVLTLQSGGEDATFMVKPLKICYSMKVPAEIPMGPKPITIQVPTPFSYKDNKAVPWNYDVKVISEGNQTRVSPESGNTVVTNIAGVGGITRSGRIYTPAELRNEYPKEGDKVHQGKGKEKEVVNEEKVGDTTKREPDCKKAVSDEEASEFLKMIKQSEYKVVDQFNRTPARITILSLLLSLEPHRKALMKVLNEAHVTQDITVNQFNGIVGNIVANNYLTFTDDEIPKEGMGHNKALHISVKCQDHIIAKVLVDNGSSLNVMPKLTLGKLSVDGTHMRPSTMVVRAFDGSRREVIGEIELPIQIGPCVFEVAFQVMDIMPAYSCLLGRPWIHSAGAVPSTLHQKVKFIIDNKLVIISGEEDLLVSKPSSTTYIEVAEEALKTSFQALEIANTTFVGEGTSIAKPSLSKTAMMTAKMMIQGGLVGKCGKLLELTENKDRYGLGYRSTKADKRRVAAEKKEKRLARLENREPNAKRVPICDIRESFRSAGLLYPDQIAVTKDGCAVTDDVNLVYPCSPQEELGNWEVVEFPMVFVSSSK